MGLVPADGFGFSRWKRKTIVKVRSNHVQKGSISILNMIRMRERIILLCWGWLYVSGRRGLRKLLNRIAESFNLTSSRPTWLEFSNLTRKIYFHRFKPTTRRYSTLSSCFFPGRTFHDKSSVWKSFERNPFTVLILFRRCKA